MRSHKSLRRAVLAVTLYLAFCTVAGIFVTDGALHPGRRPLQPEAAATIRETAREHNADLQDVSIVTSDSVTLRAWHIRPQQSNGDAVLLFHGLSDNRIGMTGYAQLFLAHGYSVLLPDARAHGASGGDLATYGLLERNDIRQWVEWMRTQDHPHCVYGFGESMGAAILLQSLDAGANFCAVVAESPFSNFREIAYDRMGQPFHLGSWFGRTILRPVVEVAMMRARWKYGLNMGSISPEKSVAAVHIPVFLIHGKIDSNIPVRHSRRIHAIAVETLLWEVPGADHCGAISAAPREFEKRIFDFLENTHASLRSAGRTNASAPTLSYLKRSP